MDSRQTVNLATKYCFLREKILKNYRKGKRIYKISKIVTAVLFSAFTVLAAAAGRQTGRPMLWLVLWLVLIFLMIDAYVLADYIRYLMEEKVIPYLEDDSVLDYGDYAIFSEDDAAEPEEEEEE